jgi:hypothetical protein
MCCVMPPASPDATRRGTDVVQQRGLTVVNVTHHGHHWRTRQGLSGLIGVFLFQERIRIVQLGSQSFVTHFLDHDHGRFLVQRWLMVTIWPSFIICLMTSEAFTAHLVSQIGHRDGFRHVKQLQPLFLQPLWPMLHV